MTSTPDDHFTASPYRRMTYSNGGRISQGVAVQLSVLGLYVPPVLQNAECRRFPPQTIILTPVQTAVCYEPPTRARS